MKVRVTDLVAAGYDQVALDSWAAGLIDLKWAEPEPSPTCVRKKEPRASQFRVTGLSCA